MTETSESSAQRRFCSRRRIGRVSGPEVVLLGGSRGAASGHERVYVAQIDFFAAARSHHRTTWMCLCWYPPAYIEYRHAACRGSLEGTTEL